MEKLNNLGAVCTAGSLRTALPALREPRRRPRSVPPRHRGQRRSLQGPGLITATIPGVGVDGDGASPECHLTPASARAWPWWDAGILRHSSEGVWEVPVRGMLALHCGKYLETRLKSTLALVGWWDGAVRWGVGWPSPLDQNWVDTGVQVHPALAPSSPSSVSGVCLLSREYGSTSRTPGPAHGPNSPRWPHAAPARRCRCRPVG